MKSDFGTPWSRISPNPVRRLFMFRRPLAVGAALGALALASPLIAQICDQSPPAAATTSLPSASGSIPPSGDMVIGGSSNYLYVMTQWGIARASLANPANPAPYNQV